MRWWRSVFRCSCVVVAVASLVGCNDAVILSITSERPVPAAVDAMCVGIADASVRGGHFGKLYALGDVQLPQTLRVDPGSADAALAWVRADRGGVATLVESARIDFGGDVTINLPRCQVGGGGAITASGAMGPANARLVASYGQGGARVVADVDHDGDADVVLGSGGSLQLWLNNGAAQFTPAPGALSGAGRVSAVSALAMGDVNGDGQADLVVGQAGPPLAAWLGTGGTFDPNDAVVPAIAVDVERLTFADANGDYTPDLAVAVRNAPMHLLIERNGRLEEQTFPKLMMTAPIAHAIAIGGWDSSCEPDLVIASDAGAPTFSGSQTVFQPGEPAPPSTDVVMTDIDGDGDLDAVIATPEGVRWLAR